MFRIGRQSPSLLSSSACPISLIELCNQLSEAIAHYSCCRARVDALLSGAVDDQLSGDVSAEVALITDSAWLAEATCHEIAATVTAIEPASAFDRATWIHTLTMYVAAPILDDLQQSACEEALRLEGTYSKRIQRRLRSLLHAYGRTSSLQQSIHSSDHQFLPSRTCRSGR